MSRPKTKASRPSLGAHSPELQNGLNGANGKKNKNVAANGKSTLQEDPREARVLDSKELLRILTEVKNGNFSVRMPIDEVGISGKICDTLNEIIDMNEKMMTVITKAGNTIGKQGKLTQRIELTNARGSWSTGIDSLNTLISDL